ncbi:MAG TPA: hypothetical protein VEA59_00470 [Patescibacteria group bacterium]|nr:hypothetical protein [Patescibacteria group bacterium]
MSNRYKILTETTVITLLVVSVKFLLHVLGWEFFAITPLHTGIFAGTIFVLGFIASSTHTDYKESEKIPAEITASLESLSQDGELFKQRYPEFRLAEYQAIITEVLVLFKEDVEHHTSKSLRKVKELYAFFYDLESLGVPANYIVKLKQDLLSVVKCLLRMRYLLKIQPLPSAFLLVEFIVFAIVGMLLFTDIPGLRNEMLVTGFFAFLYTYLLKLIAVMELPFHPQGTTKDDVSIFLLSELAERIKEKK